MRYRGSVGSPRIVRVDVFSSRPFGGNPAAVCVLEGNRETAWMQALAREMNAPATVIVQPRGDAVGLRWFSPGAELELCGHGTLAAAHVLWEEERVPHDAPARFTTRAGALAARRRDRWIELDLPADPPARTPPPPALAAALGARPRWVGRSRLDYLVLLDDDRTVRGITPDLRGLAAVDTRGVMVTAPGAPPYDFVSRFFAPRVGIPEDPVTGSAHACLASFWSRRLGKRELVAFQASPRGGVVRTRADGRRVGVAGEVVTVLAATLLT